MEEDWKPRTELGTRVKNREIIDINDILDNGLVILEPEIVDTLLPEMENDLLMIGQSKGKFGGGRRRIFRQTQKKTREGNKPKFAACAIIGNKDGILGIGYGKAQETVPAREKSLRKAKMNLFKIARGSGSWESPIKEPHTIPFAVEGRSGSVRVTLLPAPKGTGLVVEKEIQKMLALAGIEDVWSKTLGQTKNKINLIKAVEQALKQLTRMKISDKDVSNLSVVFGSTKPLAILAEEKAFAEETAAKTEETKPEEPKPEAKKGPSTPLDTIKGVGAAKMKQLQRAGIMNVEELSKADAKKVAEATNMTEEAAQKLIDAAGGWE